MVAENLSVGPVSVLCACARFIAVLLRQVGVSRALPIFFLHWKRSNAGAKLPQILGPIGLLSPSRIMPDKDGKQRISFEVTRTILVVVT